MASAADADAAVSLRDVRKTYEVGEPVHALDGVTLSIPEGSYPAWNAARTDPIDALRYE